MEDKMEIDYTSRIPEMNERVGFKRHNGIILMSIGDGKSTCEAELLPTSLNDGGNPHGGLLFSLLDVATGFAARSHGRKCVTAASSVSFLNAAKGTKLHAVGETIKVGRKIATVEGRVYDDTNLLLATGLFTYCFIED